MTTTWDVIVVGGGLAGLAAGATAARAGASTLVVEAHQAGGRARTVDRDGFTLNMGGHALYLGGPGTSVLRSLGVDPDGAAPPLDRYRALTGGHQHILPSGPRTLLQTTLLGRRSKAQFAKLLGLVPLLNPSKLAGTSVAAWLGDHNLQPDTESLVRALVRLSTYTADLDDFGADAAVAQLQIAARPGVTYLHRGWAQLIERLSEQVEVRAGVQVAGLEVAAGRVEVKTANGTLVSRRVVLAPGGPEAVRGLLPADPGWGDLGGPVTAACLDVGVKREPHPGYVLGLDDPLYGTVQSPPARQAPPGQAVVAVIRYGARRPEEDRPQLERHLREVGVQAEDVVVSRFLARMVVAGSLPRATIGGMRGRPDVSATGLPGVFVAGDWVGPRGLLADASLASGHAASLLAVRQLSRSSTLVA